MSERAELLEELSRGENKLTRTLQLVDTLEEAGAHARSLSIGISANISLDLFSVFLRKHALLANARIDAQMGSFNDPMTDVASFAAAKTDGMILLTFFDNILPALEAQLPHLSENHVAATLQDFRARYRFVFEAAKNLPFLFVPSLHRFGQPIDTGTTDIVGETIDQLNAGLREDAADYPNVRIIDSASIVAELGAAKCFDQRFYFQSTAPYTAAFLDALARRIMSASRAFNGYYRKALVLDCDNTLWGGVIGEDLIDGIKLDPYSNPGRVFWRVQHEFLNLESNGVLLCLVSKNEPADVDEVLRQHPHMVLKDKNIALKKVNWDDKVSNLKAIASELNIGLDSLVFVDDSPFECEAVKAALPMVQVFQVPKAVSAYPDLVREIKDVFLGGGITKDGASKTEQYRQLRQAAEASVSFATHEEYLASLDLKVRFHRDDAASEARISELTLKSNQFNLTTLRQTPSEIREKMGANDWSVYSLRVEDRFGDAGLTGVVLAHWQDETVRIEAFLMSCRVIGRGVEFSIWPHILDDARSRGCIELEAEYRPTAKNAQVADFYDRLGLPLIEENNGNRLYRASLETFTPETADWIKVIRD